MRCRGVSKPNSTGWPPCGRRPLPATHTPGRIERALGIGAFASGGILTRPTLGLLAENEPEGVFPLSRLKDIVGGSSVVYNFAGANIYGYDDFAAKVNRAGIEANQRGRQQIFR